MQKFTLYDFNKMFSDEDACLDLVRDMVYPNGIVCRKCGEGTRHYKLANRKAYSCDRCGTHVYPLAGTIFEKSSTPLKSWFYAMYLVASTRCGISAKQIERELGVSYKTAHRMFKQIRKLLAEDNGPFSGIVEADETYMGGKEKNRHANKKTGVGSGTTGKTPVFGLVERQGRILAKVVPNARGETLLPLIQQRVTEKTIIHTDEWGGYKDLGKTGYEHHSVQHSAKVYVSGNVHTNTIEGFWSLMKRGIGGVYHSVSPAYLQAYVDEYSFRYNHRGDDQPMFKAIAGRLSEVRHGRFGEYAPISE